MTSFIFFLNPFAFSSTGFNYSRDGQTFILQETRVKIAAEFVDAMKSERRHGFGVLLSGPNGVGKSSCGLLAYLTCVAQSLTVVYIPNARAWTQAAMKGDGDKFFLKLLLTLNAGSCQQLHTSCQTHQSM